MVLFNRRDNAPARRRAALVRAAIDMGASERERAVALSLLRGSTYDPAAGDVPKKRLFASLFFRRIF